MRASSRAPTMAISTGSATVRSSTESKRPNAAVSGLDFLLGSMREGGRLRRSYKDGTTHIDAFLEDYAAVGNAILTVYEATLEPRWLDEAAWTTERVVEFFWDDTHYTEKGSQRVAKVVSDHLLATQPLVELHRQAR